MTIYSSERVFPHKVVPFAGLDDKKIMFGGQNSPKHKILRGISGAQMDFVGGPALQNYNSRWRRPPSWIFAQTAIITQPPIYVDV